jgi:hypothetical protein
MVKYCLNPKTRKFDHVKGSVTPFADIDRMTGGKCGPNGKYWEPRLSLWEIFGNWFNGRGTA